MLMAAAPTKARKDRSVSARQCETLELIERYTRTHGYSPSFRDLSEAQDVAVHCINQRIERLESLGLIVRDRRRARTLTLTDKGRDLLLLEQRWTLVNVDRTPRRLTARVILARLGEGGVA